MSNNNNLEAKYRAEIRALEARLSTASSATADWIGEQIADLEAKLDELDS